MKSGRKSIIGMTLIEVLVYLAIFGLFFTVIINFFFFLQDNNERSGETLKIDRAVIFLTQHFDDSFEKATSASGSTVYNNTNGELYLLGSTNVNYKLVTSKIQFNDGVIDKQLTRGDLQVTKFLLEEIKDNSDTVIGVEITVGIRSIADSSVSKEFTNSYIFNQ